MRLSQSELGSVEFNDSLEPDIERIRDIVKGVKTTVPEFFSKPAPGVPNHNINPQTTPAKKSLKQMTDAELAEYTKKVWG